MHRAGYGKYGCSGSIGYYVFLRQKEGSLRPGIDVTVKFRNTNLYGGRNEITAVYLAQGRDKSIGQRYLPQALQHIAI